MKKILALVLALMLVLSMTAALAVEITLERDSSYDADATVGNRVYTYYKVFDAEYTTSASNGVAYTLPVGSTVAAALGWDNTSKTFTAASGQKWFTLTPTVDGNKLIVEATANMKVAADAQEAAEWLMAHGNLGDGTQMTFTDASASNKAKWTSGEVDPGYYIVKSSSGANLVAATTDINITEKNKYPPIDKKQKKANGTWTDDPLPTEIGKVIDYKLEIPVPADANKAIAVIDKMTVGLTYDPTSLSAHLDAEDGAAVPYTAMTSSADKEYDSGSDVTFQIKFSDDTVTSAAGHTIIILYKATVNVNALVDTGKENDVTLYYDEGRIWIPDHVNYEIYTTGAVKYDGATADVNADTNALTKKGQADIAYLKGAEFKLQVQVGKTGEWADLAVAKASDNTYHPKTSSETAATIASDDNGAIIIRGLDKENAYRLIETKAPDGGYNLLSSVATLPNLKKDDKVKVALKGSAEDTTYLDNDAVELSAKIANNKGNELPHTGGMGTTILYIGGSILVLAAVILLVTKRRMKVED